MIFKAVEISLLFLAALQCRGVYATDVDCTPERFENALGGPLEFECPSGSAITAVESCFGVVPDGGAGNGDRQWLFKCKAISGIRKEECTWFNNVDRPILSDGGDADPSILFQCPANYYMAGVRGTYMSATGDRTWDSKCCKLKQWCQRDCMSSGDFTNLQSDFYYFPPTTDYKTVYAFVGVFSEFSSAEPEDRRWKLLVCKFSLCDYDVIIEDKEELQAT